MVPPAADGAVEASLVVVAGIAIFVLAQLNGVLQGLYGKFGTKVNGVATTGWPQVAISIRPSDMGPSRRSGELELTIENRLGSRASWSRSICRAV